MKKILFVVHRIPYPPNKGDKIRSFNELKFLAQRHSVDLLCLADDKDDLKYKEDLEKICDQVEVFLLNAKASKIRGGLALLLGGVLSSRYFYHKGMQSTFDHWLQTRKYDVIFCFSSSMAECIFRSRYLVQLDVSEKPQLMMDFCDVDSDKWRQYSEDSKFPLSWLYELEHRRLMEYECRIQQYFDNTVLVSMGEAELLRGNCLVCSNLTVVPNGVDHHYFSSLREGYKVEQTLPAGELAIVFTGAMDYPVNINGILWFVKNVWLQLLQRCPQLHLYIVGSNPTTEIMALGKDSQITVTGFVEDIRGYYALADICIAPLHQGRGIQNKVLEAMSMGKPVVSTSRANAGVQGIPGEHLLIADTADSFTTSLRQLIADPQQRDRIGQAARNYVVRNFDWNTNMLILEKLILGTGSVVTSGERYL